MPYSLVHDQTPKGLRITRLNISGKMSAEEAANLMVELGPGGRHADLPLLVISDPSTDIGAGARRIFTSGQSPDQPQQVRGTAVVTQSALMRVTVNFIGRVNRNQSTRLFATEAEALGWLEQEHPAPTTRKDAGA